MARLCALLAFAGLVVAHASSPLVAAQTTTPTFVASNLVGLPTNYFPYTDFSGATIDGQGNLWTVDNAEAAVVSYRFVFGAWYVARSISIAAIDGIAITDPESITWIDGRRFAVVDEETNALHYLDFSGAKPIRERLVPLGEKIPIPSRNRGIEGLTYDHDASTASIDVFYAGVEEPATLYRVAVGRGFNVKAMPLPIPEIAGLEKVPGTNDLYVISEANNTIYRTTTAGAAPAVIASAREFAQPEGIALDTSGSLLVVGEAGKYEREFATYRKVTLDIKRPSVIQSQVTTSHYELEVGANDVEETNGRLSDSTASLSINAATKVGFRIPNVCVEKAQAIVGAHLALYASSTSTERTVVTVRADTAVDPARFSDASLVARKYTSAAQRWRIPPTAPGTKLISPDLSAVLSEVTNQPDWPGCGDIVIVVQGSGDRMFRSFDGDRSAAALLDVETIDVPGVASHVPGAAPGPANMFAFMGAESNAPIASSAPADEPSVSTIEAEIRDGGQDRERMGTHAYSTSNDLDLTSGIEVMLSYDVCVPLGSEIDDARIEFVATTDNATPTTTSIRAGIADAWSSGSVDWNIAEWVRGGQDASPDLSAVINEALQSTEWTGCGEIEFGFTSEGRREAHSFESSSGPAPRLVITAS